MPQIPQVEYLECPPFEVAVGDEMVALAELSVVALLSPGLAYEGDRRICIAETNRTAPVVDGVHRARVAFVMSPAAARELVRSIVDALGAIAEVNQPAEAGAQETP